MTTGELGELVFKVKPIHFRAIYYYNVSSGYSCPVLETISIKDKQ